MRLLDTLKGLTTKAKQAAAEHTDELHQAVEKGKDLADQRTQGKYHKQIQKAGAKVDAQLDELAGRHEDPPPPAIPGSNPTPE